MNGGLALGGETLKAQFTSAEAAALAWVALVIKLIGLAIILANETVLSPD